MRRTAQTARRDGKRAGAPPAALIIAPATLSRPERETMRVRVYRALARGLMAGMFSPGEAVTLRILASDFRGALSHNMVFHFTLYEGAGKPVVLALIEMLWLQAGPFLALSLTIPGVRWTARHHHAVLAALRASLVSSARRAIEADI